MIIDFSYLPIEVDSAIQNFFEDLFNGHDSPHHKIEATMYDDDSNEDSGSAYSVVFTKGFENNAALTSLVLYTYEQGEAKAVAAWIKQPAAAEPKFHHMEGLNSQSFFRDWCDSILKDISRDNINEASLHKDIPTQFFLDKALTLGLEQALELRFQLRTP